MTIPDGLHIKEGDRMTFTLLPNGTPVIVGEDFLFNTGCFLELGQSKRD